MKLLPTFSVFLVLTFLGSLNPVLAWPRPVTLGTIESADETTRVESGEVRSTIVIDGVAVPYRGKVASMSVNRNEQDKHAKIYYTEYVRTDVSDVSSRPVTFCFNGGPGSASLWLHLGGLSPRRIELIPNELNPQRWKLVPNRDSIIGVTDLVFIDPVNTGFSRADKPEDKGEFIGFDHDIESIAEFIRRWTAENGRWSSPQFILGESYGGIRGARLSGHLMDKHAYQVEGLILVSPVVDFQTIRFEESNDLPYILFLPSYTAVAWHHHRIDRKRFPELGDALDAAEEFALGDFALALLHGDRMTEKKRRRVLQKMSQLTGLSVDYLDRADLRVPMSRFGKELLREEGLVVGRYDGRFSGPTWDFNNDRTEFDPSGKYIGGAFAEAMQQYYFDEFGLRLSTPYAVFGDVHPWDYSRFEGRFPNAADTLRKAMVQTPNLKVLFLLGYTDLATPYMGSEHTISHLGLPAAVRENISMRYYNSGHMMYLDDESQRFLKEDLTEFYSAVAGSAPEDEGDGAQDDDE